jgi:subtilisin family serine protease
MKVTLRAIATGVGRIADGSGIRPVLLGLLIIVIAAGGTVAAAADAIALPSPAKFRTDRILVKPKMRTDLTGLHQSLGTRVRRAFAKIGGLQVVDLPAGADHDGILRALRQSSLVEYAEPDYIVRSLDTIPNDFRYWDGSLWGLHNTGIYGGTPGCDIHAQQAWDIQDTAANVIVAVVDTGVRYTHEDLTGNMWVNPGESGLDAQGNNLATNGVDDDGDGYIDDVHGINAITGSGDPWDDFGHGTHVNGIIGAMGNNGIGVTGVAWSVQLMNCKFIDSQGNGSLSDAITCLDYARAKGAKIINASWGSYSFTSSALRDAINSLRDADIIFVAACGNDNNNNDATSLVPASYEFDNIIAVAATDRTDAKASFSNFGGSTVHLGAPGSPIFSTWNGSDSDYRYLDGTSMAAPFVAGACALIWARYPTLTHHEVISRILSTVDPCPDLAGVTVSGGRLNLAAALAPQAPSSPPLETTWVDDALPDGAQPDTEGGDTWLWTASPAPYSGSMEHLSALAAGQHGHSFTKATATLTVYDGDTLFAYVYLDPTTPPREIMISWNDGCWEHRAFWGEDLIPYGEYGTSSRQDMGALPATGQWVRLQVPANALGLEGAQLKGMSFTLVDGQAAWDVAGRRTGPPIGP